MKQKENITFIPPIDSKQHGWLHIGGEIHVITNIHSFDDFGHTLETFTLEDGQEVYSQDEGELTTELYEG